MLYMQFPRKSSKDIDTFLKGCCFSTYKGWNFPLAQWRDLYQLFLIHLIAHLCWRWNVSPTKKIRCFLKTGLTSLPPYMLRLEVHSFKCCCTVSYDAPSEHSRGGCSSSQNVQPVHLLSLVCSFRT